MIHQYIIYLSPELVTITRSQNMFRENLREFRKRREIWAKMGLENHSQGKKKTLQKTPLSEISK